MKKFVIFEINNKGINKFFEKVKNLYEEIKPELIQDLDTAVRLSGDLYWTWLDEQMIEFCYGITPRLETIKLLLYAKRTLDSIFEEELQFLSKNGGVAKLGDFILWVAGSQLLSIVKGEEDLVPPNYEKEVVQLLTDCTKELSFLDAYITFKKKHSNGRSMSKAK